MIDAAITKQRGQLRIISSLFLRLDRPQSVGCFELELLQSLVILNGGQAPPDIPRDRPSPTGTEGRARAFLSIRRACQ